MGVKLIVRPLSYKDTLVATIVYYRFVYLYNLKLVFNCPRAYLVITDALSTMLRLLGKELEEASWLIQARSRMEPVEPYNEEW